MSGSVLQIFVMRGGTLLASELFPEGVYLVGSDPSCDLVLDDPTVALQHAQLQFGGGQALLVDDAGAGVLINGEPAQISVVRSADDVQIGPFVLKIRVLARRRAPLPSAPPPGSGGARLAMVPRSQVAAPPRALSAVPEPPPRLVLDEIDALFDEAMSPAPQAVPPPPPPEAVELSEADLSSFEAVMTPSEVQPVAPMAPPAEAPARPFEASPADGFLAAMAENPPPLEAPPALREVVPAPSPARELAPQLVAAPPTPAATPKLKKVQKSAAPSSAALAPAAVLHARVLWGEALMAARTFAGDAVVATAADERGALQAYGFPAVARLAVPEGAGWRVTPPQGANALERIAGGPWHAAQVDARGQLRLNTGRSLRLSQGGLHIELVAERPAARVSGGVGRLVDWRGLFLVAALGLAMVAFIRLLPSIPKDWTPPAPPPHRLVRAEFKQEKPKRPKREKPTAQAAQRAPEAPKPSAAESARSYKQAAAPLRALEKVTRATADVSRLLSSLKLVSARPRGGSPDALAGMPNGHTQKPLPGIGGGVGMGGSPVTHGRDLLRGGPGGGNGGGAGDLGTGTAGKGPVRGIPVVLPSRPAKVQGQIDRDAVAKVINDRVNEIRGCYERALLGNPNLGAGKVTLEWTIAKDGSVAEVGTKVATLKSAEVTSCLLDLLRGLQFPKPLGGVAIVSYPILFNSVGY